MSWADPRPYIAVNKTLKDGIVMGALAGNQIVLRGSRPSPGWIQGAGEADPTTSSTSYAVLAACTFVIPNWDDYAAIDRRVQPVFLAKVSGGTGVLRITDDTNSDETLHSNEVNVAAASGYDNFKSILALNLLLHFPTSGHAKKNTERSITIEGKHASGSIWIRAINTPDWIGWF